MKYFNFLIIFFYIFLPFNNAFGNNILYYQSQIEEKSRLSDFFLILMLLNFLIILFIEYLNLLKFFFNLNLLGNITNHM